MQYKNFFESPDISLTGKTAHINNVSLKDIPVEDVKENIVFLRNDQDGFFPLGFTLIYFMDSSESAQKLKNGEIPYLMIPRATIHSGGSPITDVWKKKFQQPGTEHILGLVEAITNDETIFIDMISVRPKYQKNSIARKMIDMARKHFPDAKITHSSATPAGQKFNNSYKKSLPDPTKWGGERGSSAL
jgi:hypothetical protein